MTAKLQYQKIQRPTFWWCPWKHQSLSPAGAQRLHGIPLMQQLRLHPKMKMNRCYIMRCTQLSYTTRSSLLFVRICLFAFMLSCSQAPRSQNLTAKNRVLNFHSGVSLLSKFANLSSQEILVVTQ